MVNPLAATVVRSESTEFGTAGVLTLENGWKCNTLELPWMNNATGRSCTIADRYLARMEFNDHLGSKDHELVTRDDGTTFDLYHMIYRFEDKHGRVACMIHNGNFAGEVKLGHETQVHGCTEVGGAYGEIDRDDGGGKQWGIMDSRNTLKALLRHTKGRPLLVTYSWADGCEPEDLSDVQQHGQEQPA